MINVSPNAEWIISIVWLIVNRRIATANVFCPSKVSKIEKKMLLFLECDASCPCGLECPAGCQDCPEHPLCEDDCEDAQINNDQYRLCLNQAVSQLVSWKFRFNRKMYFRMFAWKHAHQIWAATIHAMRLTRNSCPIVHALRHRYTRLRISFSKNKLKTTTTEVSTATTTTTELTPIDPVIRFGDFYLFINFRAKFRSS